MLEISQITTVSPILQKEADYVPFRNRLRYQRNTEAKMNKTQNYSHNSYEELLKFNLNEFGSLVE
jgi:hypothetical protein